MGQINVSMPGRLAEYLRRKVESGRYQSESEVLIDALRRMEDEDRRILRLGKPTAEDILADLTQTQLHGIRSRVLKGLAEIKAGKLTEYEGQKGLHDLAAEVKARGRKRTAPGLKH